MRFWLKVFFRAIKELLADGGLNLAASISYYVLFSLFPLLIFLFSVLSYFLVEESLQQKILDSILQWIPTVGREEQNMVVGAIREVTRLSKVTGVVGFLLMAWSGSSMFATIRQALNTVFNLQTRRPFLRQKLMDLAMVAGTGLFFLLSVASTATVETLKQLSLQYPVLYRYAWVQNLIGEGGMIWTLASGAIPFFLSLIAFLFLYWAAPEVRMPLPTLLPGAMAGAVLFEILKKGFAFYLAHFARYSVVFGSLATVVVFLFWIDLGAIVLIFGAEFSSEIRKLRSETSKTVNHPQK